MNKDRKDDLSKDTLEKTARTLYAKSRGKRRLPWNNLKKQEKEAFYKFAKKRILLSIPWFNGGY